jgi:hypothetical protein
VHDFRVTEREDLEVVLWASLFLPVEMKDDALPRPRRLLHGEIRGASLLPRTPLAFENRPDLDRGASGRSPLPPEVTPLPSVPADAVLQERNERLEVTVLEAVERMSQLAWIRGHDSGANYRTSRWVGFSHVPKHPHPA